MKNQVQLIAYVDRLAGNLSGLRALLAGPLAGLFGGVHLLPFFHRIDGADAGFDPIDHLRVDDRLGGWADIAALAGECEPIADVIVNHVSSHSPQFLDWSARGADSPSDGLFLTLDAVFPHGAREADLLAIYRPRPGLPFSAATLADGRKVLLWTTFTPQQIDIDVDHPAGQAYLDAILRTLAHNGVRTVRLDAIGYAVKRAGTSCFMLAQTQAFIDHFGARAHALGMQVLVEIHAHHQTQIEIARRVDWVYDFALPPLVLHALHFGRSAALKRWIGIRPANALTVLDTHDGIGIIDIGADPASRIERPGLLPDAELDALVERIHAASGGQSRQATGAAASNLDLYQINCTFFDALGRDVRAMLLARAIQFVLPGIPQVYYVGLLFGENDIALLEASGVGRDINRHRYSAEEIAGALARPGVRSLFELIRLRNTHPAFEGAFMLRASPAHRLAMRWEHAEAWLELEVDLAARDATLAYSPAPEAASAFVFPPR